VYRDTDIEVLAPVCVKLVVLSALFFHHFYWKYQKKPREREREHKLNRDARIANLSLQSTQQSTRMMAVNRNQKLCSGQNITKGATI